MTEEERRSLTPRQYIHRLFADTRDGKLEITYYHPQNLEPPHTRTYEMHWGEAELEQMVQRYEKLETMLRTFAGLQTQLEEEETRKKVLNQEQLQAWETFVKPFPPFEVTESVIGELYYRAEFDTLDDEENELLERYYWWRQNNSLARLPFLRRSPADMILRAQRYETLVGWNAPEEVLMDEGRWLAEEMVLYYYGPQEIQEKQED